MDLAITDQTMLKLIRTELATIILEIIPGFPVILCMGYSKTITAEDDKHLRVSEIIFKSRLNGRSCQRV